MDSQTALFFLFLVILFLLFLVCRKLVLWYYKISRHIELETEILETLKRIEAKIGEKEE